MSKKLLQFLILVFVTISSQIDGIAKEPVFVANYDESKMPGFELPDPLVDQEGNRIRSAEQWKASRRAEIKELFVKHVFGRMPDQRRIRTSELQSRSIPI